MDGAPLRASVRDRIQKLKELRRAQHRVRDATSFDQPFLDALCTQVSAVADAIRTDHRKGDVVRDACRRGGAEPASGLRPLGFGGPPSK